MHGNPRMKIVALDFSVLIVSKEKGPAGGTLLS